MYSSIFVFWHVPQLKGPKSAVGCLRFRKYLIGLLIFLGMHKSDTGTYKNSAKFKKVMSLKTVNVMIRRYSYMIAVQDNAG